MDPDFLFPLKYRKCRTCNVNITYLLQWEKCWSKTKTHLDQKTETQKGKNCYQKMTMTIKVTTSMQTFVNYALATKRTGGFVHNTSCHFLCCYKCCKTDFEQNGHCLYCCQIIEKIIKIHC